MKFARVPAGVSIALALTAAASPGIAQAPSDPRIAQDGTVTLDGVRVPLPATASQGGRDYLRKLIVDKPFGTPVPDIKEERARQDGIMFEFLRPMRDRYKVDITEEKIGGIVVDVVVPAEGIAPENRNRLLINVHGGGFTTGARSASLVESVPLAALMKIKVVSIDYRMGPEYQFPAGSEDVATVYRELLKSYDASHIGLYGCSAGGILTSQSIAWFQANDLPNPAAIGVFCAGLNGRFEGDSVALSGGLLGNLPALVAESRPAMLPPGGPSYLSTARPEDPLAFPESSPELLAHFPPTLFITGTRSFEFSSALTSHNSLAAAGVESRFHGWDGMFHGFIYNSDLPEARQAYDVMVNFFDGHLKK
ncbi:MAG TPA: alpha/beta hydrolase fold domain-containing protein [Croceibacterium sp.]|nr:alpha/beta hydrolase fold domain-containing protein [Croceibacterium sp.]